MADPVNAADVLDGLWELGPQFCRDAIGTLLDYGDGDPVVIMPDRTLRSLVELPGLTGWFQLADPVRHSSTASPRRPTVADGYTILDHPDPEVQTIAGLIAQAFAAANDLHHHPQAAALQQHLAAALRALDAYCANPT